MYKALLIIFALYVNLPAQVTEEWIQRYNGSGNSFDIVNRADIDKQGNVYVSGSSNGAGTLNDFLIVKYTNAGSPVWTARFNSKYGLADALKSSVLDSTGNIYAAGSITDSSGNTRLTVIKIDSSGVLSWSETPTFTGITSSYAQSIMINNEGNVVIVGTGQNAAGNYDILIAKFTPSGSELWKRIYSQTLNETPVSAGIDAFNNIYISASSSLATSNADMLLLKYNTAGAQEWLRTYGTPPFDDKPAALRIDKENSIIVTGAAGTLYSDYVTIKYTATGDTLWTRKYNGTGNHLDIPYAMALDSINNIYITGSSRSAGTLGSEDIATLKYSPEGQQVWAERFNGAANGTDIGISIAVDNMQNVYIAGSTDTASFKMIYATVKYNTAGKFNWLKTYSISPKSPEDFAYDIKLDRFNNVFVTGISFGIGTDYDFATIKYSQTSAVTGGSGVLPSKYFLYQNYPNPFNPETRISFDINKAGIIKLGVYNSAGEEVNLLLNEKLNPGSYSVLFNGYGLPSGIYFYRLSGENFSYSRKMILLK